MGLPLIALGIIIALLVSYWPGIILVIIGLVLLFVPGPFYGYPHWHDRRRRPPT